MILTCPNCSTQYVVKDGAIPPEGRQVRCAACKHSWHQDAAQSAEAEVSAPTAEAEPQQAPEPIAEAEEEESLTEATLIDPRSGPETEERAYEEAAIESDQEPIAEEAPAESEEMPSATYAGAQFDIGKPATTAPAAVADWNEPPQAEPETDEFSPFPAADEVEPRTRNRLLPILIALVVIAALAAAFWFLAPPEWKARLGLAAVDSSPLALVTTHVDREPLESGNELLTVTGRVINPTAQEQDVPPLQAQLKTRTGRVVYSWTIQPPARSLPAGASASFNSAEVNVPPGGDELTITLGSRKA